MEDLRFVREFIDEHFGEFEEMAGKIWALAELPFEEVESVEVLQGALETRGFAIEEGVADLPTAFVASYGSGRPYFGFLAEYDALDMLSQQAGVSEKRAVEGMAPGHGCGHNLIGVGCVAASLAVQAYLEETGKAGTVYLFGCPGEEGAGGKTYMAKAGLFDELDLVYTWHPSSENRVQVENSSAILAADFTFTGKSAHAGSSPWLGRSGLDACELMNVGSNYLREHIQDQERIHYAYMNAGGTAPNVVPQEATIRYEVRSPKLGDMMKLYERIKNVARGAALMTETELSFERKYAFADYQSSRTLWPIAQRALEELGPPEWTEEDYTLAKEFLTSYDGETQEQAKVQMMGLYGMDRVEEKFAKPLDDEIQPLEYGPVKYSSGSTDVGDVSYVCPTVTLLTATACLGNVAHTWQTTAQSLSPIGFKGMRLAAQGMALAAIRTMEDKDLIEKAKDETKERRLKAGGIWVLIPVSTT